MVCPDHFVLTTANVGGQLGSTCQLGSIEQMMYPEHFVLITPGVGGQLRSVFQPGMISPASATQEQPGVHGVP